MALSKAAKLFTKLYQKQVKSVADEDGGFGKEYSKVELSKRKITPEEAKILIKSSDLYGGTDGAFDKIVDLELKSIAAGTKPQRLKSFWIATGTAADPEIEKLTQDELLDMILNKKIKKSTGGLLGNQKEIDADNDGEITDKDFALLRERKETGGLLEMDREEYGLGGLVKLLKQVPKEVSKNLPKGAADDLSSDDAKQILKFVTENDDSLPDLKMIARLGKDLDIKDFNLSDKQMREAIAMKELLEIANTTKGGKAKYLEELMDDEAFEMFGEMYLFDDALEPAYDTRLMKAEGGSSLLADDLQDMEDIEKNMESDEKMEDNYTDYILSEALSEEEQETLEKELNNNEELNSLFEKVMDVAQEFSGSGPVEGPGTGVSDSVPARLSDGEFVFTAKAVEEIGADTLMAMMKEAEAEADKRQEAYEGGPIKEEMSRLLDSGEDVTDEINKQMMLDPYQRHVRS